MFDLKYYNNFSKMDKYFDEDKGKFFSRQTIHKMTSVKKKLLLQNRIDELPDEEYLKHIIQSLYKKKGEAGIVDIQHALPKS